MATVTARVDENVKKEAETLFKKMGLNMSTAMNLFLKKCILEQGIPFELKVPNKETRKVLDEVEKGVGLSKTFDSIDELTEDLEDDEKTSNKETLKAMQETDDILSGKIERKGYKSAEELFEDLGVQLMKLTIKTTKRFDKDLKKLKKRKYDLTLLAQIINKLSDSEILPKKYRDHYLTGDYKGFRECHIQPDWLLIYKIEKNILVLTLSRTGTHSDLF